MSLKYEDKKKTQSSSNSHKIYLLNQGKRNGRKINGKEGRSGLSNLLKDDKTVPCKSNFPVNLNLNLNPFVL